VNFIGKMFLAWNWIPLILLIRHSRC